MFELVTHEIYLKTNNKTPFLERTIIIDIDNQFVRFYANLLIHIGFYIAGGHRLIIHGAKTNNEIKQRHAKLSHIYLIAFAHCQQRAPTHHTFVEIDDSLSYTNSIFVAIISEVCFG